MSISLSSSPSLFKKNDDGSSVSRRAHLEQAVQKFEGLLWGEVAQAMSAVKMGPSSTGYGGQVYQRMMWRRVARHDFAQVDKPLTRTTMNQLMGPVTRTTRATAASAQGPAGLSAPDAASGNQDPQSWIQEIWNAVKSGAQALGVPVKGLLAQAALETGWGQHAKSNNLFGVKAHGSGSSFSALTHEFQGGVMRQVRANFQHYPSAQHAVKDFVAVLEHAHPQAVGQSTVAGYAQALQASGYATDPRYAAKIESVANSARMHQLVARVKK